jgi:hypothetical protein
MFILASSIRGLPDSFKFGYCEYPSYDAHCMLFDLDLDTSF